MTSKWMDSATTLAAFHYQSKVYEEDRPRTFADEDKPFDQRKESDKNKSEPTGGNTRIAMVNFGEAVSTDEYMHSLNPNDNDDRNQTNNTALSSSGTSDSDSSSGYLITDSVPAKSSRTASRRSFVSISSRERHRQYSEAENFRRARRQFSSRTSPRDHYGSKGTSQSILHKIFSRNKLHQSDSSALEMSERKNSTNEASIGTLILNSSDNVAKGEHQNTLPGNSLSIIVSGTPRRALSHGMPSMPIVQTRERKDGGILKSLRGHDINKAQSDRHYGKQLSPEEHKNRHRRLPSTDLPVSGPGGNVVKSFKPNPSLDWQKRHRTVMPRNIGIHPTAFHAPFGSDFEKLLLKEEAERQEEARKKQSEDLKHRKNETRNELHGAHAGEGFLGAARRRVSLASLKSFKKHTIRSISDSSGISNKRGEGDGARSSVSAPATFIADGNGSRDTDRNNQSVDNVKPPDIMARLKLVDLPSIHKQHSVVNSEISFGSSRTLLKNSVSEFGSRSFPLQSGNTTNKYGRPPVQKMNGRASLFLQEAAHLYSLMSATAMASLRADMEGVSSPLVDYVPGQKFPPVNPEEMQIKILLSNSAESDAKSVPSDQDGIEKDSTENDDLETELQPGESFRFNSNNVQIKRNNKYSNIFMFLFGLSRNSRQRTIYNASRPFSVLGGISDAEVEMLRKVRGPSAQHALCSLWLREFITREHLDGSTGGIAPPIVARVYQFISDGTQQYNNCRKTAFTDFPFPHAQLTSFFGFVSIFVFPLLYYTYINNIHIALILNFFTVSCFIGIQEVALELEEPFIRYPNDLPLNNYQAQFNEALISSLYGGFHPDAWGDFGANGGKFGTNNDDDVKSESDDS